MSGLRGVRYFLEYCFYLFFSRGIWLLPHRFAGALGGGVGRLAFLIPSSGRRLTLENLAAAYPDWDAATLRRTAERCFRHWGRMFSESLSMARFDRERLLALFEAEGEEHVEAARASGKGLLLCSGHWGAFETAAFYLGNRFGTIQMLARQQNNPLVDADLHRLRERNGNRVIPRRGAAHRVLNALRRGEVVALAIDQRVKPGDGILVDFLGRPAWISPIPAFTAAAAEVPCLPVAVLPLPGGRYRIRFRAPIEPGRRDGDSIARHTRRNLQAIEKDVREIPELWFWMHNMWMLCARRRWAYSISELRRRSELPPAPAAPLEGRAAAGEGILATIDGNFLETGRTALLDDGEGEGRASRVLALGHALVERGFAVLYLELTELLRRLGDAARRDLVAELQQLDRIDLLIVVVAGEPSLSAAESDLLIRLIERRFDRRSTLWSLPDRGWLARALPSLPESYDG